MTLEEFLDRVVAPGAWLATAYKGLNTKFAHKFYDRADISSAANFLRGQAPHADTWFAIASFSKKTRTQDNADHLKAFWTDADIKRDGDGKDPAHVFTDDVDAIRWLAAFGKATGIPRPNILIKSGYGIHIYWTFEDALPAEDWRAYAEVLKAQLVKHGFKGDVSVTADEARIMRPPETQNHKDPGNPVPTYVIMPDKLVAPDYPNDVLLPAIMTVPPSVTGIGAPPSSLTNASGSSLAAAKAGIQAAPRDFAAIAANCAQVQTSLAAGGNGDSRDVWWRLVTLSTFCEHGRDWAHEVSKNDPRYTEDETDEEYDRAVNDRAKKGVGPPLCTALDTARPGICQACPHYNNSQVTSPFHLGIQAVSPDDPDELPYSWRRNNGWIERRDKEKNWHKLLEGDVSEPILDNLEAGGYRLTFTYAPPPKNPARTVYVDNTELTLRNAKGILCARGLHIGDDSAPNMCRFLMAWMEKLQREMKVRAYPTPSFGWYVTDKGVAGFSAGGKCYLSGGTDISAPGADRTLIARYQPIGELTKWQAAAKFVAADSPHIHAVIAVSFAAPLMYLQGGSGAVLSFVGKSGVGKTAGAHVGQSVWADPVKASFSVDDTDNYKIKAISDIRSMPVYWDEAKADDEIKRLVNEIHKFTQGRDKGRLMVDTKVREVGDWSTLYAILTNSSVRDLISDANGDTDATQLRVLEIRVERPALAYDPAADAIVSSLRNHRGVAGEVYARYIADNHGRVSKLLEQTKQKINTAIQPSNDERFYVSATTAVVVGAQIARHLKLIDLDVQGIYSVLLEAIRASRKVREELSPQDTEDALVRRIDEFITAYRHECLVTDILRSPGPAAASNPKPQSKRIPDQQPKDGYGIAYHIAIAEGVLRINARVWRHYWNFRKLSPTDLREKAEARWGIQGVFSERGLGHGTDWVVAKAYAFSLDLDKPELQYIVTPWRTSTNASGSSNIIPLPTRPGSP